MAALDIDNKVELLALERSHLAEVLRVAREEGQLLVASKHVVAEVDLRLAEIHTVAMLGPEVFRDVIQAASAPASDLKDRLTLAILL